MIFRRFAVALLLVATACSGELRAPQSSTVDESKPVLQPDGPLRGLSMVAEAGGDGSLPDPQLAFTTDDAEAIAVVGLRDDVSASATLTVEWYRLTGIDGRDYLFSHEIPIGPGGHAISQGLAAGGLAPGLYETVAILDDRQVRTPWVVRVADKAADGQAGMGAAAFTLMSVTGLAQVGDEDWNVPDSGDSGWYDPQEEAGEPPPPGPCGINSINPTWHPLTTIRGSVSWHGTCSTMALSATVSGPPQTIASGEFTQDSPPWLDGAADVCSLPGGRDMPETIVSLAAMGSEGASDTASYTLPDLGETLVASILSQPEGGSRVEPADTIDALGVGMLMAPALGIEKVSLYADGALLDTAGNASGSSQPEPCDLGRFYAEIRATYIVPDDPPPVIEICAEVVGFDGNEDRGCAEFYTGEVWTGTYAGTVTWDCGPLGRVPDGTLAGSFAIVVAADRTATMESDHTVTGSCAGPGGSLTTPVTVTGERTDSGFEFPNFLGASGTINIAVIGNRGTGTFTGPAPSAEVTVDLEVACSTC